LLLLLWKNYLPFIFFTYIYILYFLYDMKKRRYTFLCRSPTRCLNAPAVDESRWRSMPPFRSYDIYNARCTGLHRHARKYAFHDANVGVCRYRRYQSFYRTTRHDVSIIRCWKSPSLQRMQLCTVTSTRYVQLAPN